MHIALLEDDKDQADIMKLWLEAAGHDVMHFCTGQALKDSLAKHEHDLFILDWMLPDINGDEVLKWLRNVARINTPILFVTLKDNKEDIVRALELGADDFMSKPVSRREVLARVNALGRRQQTVPRNEPEVLEFPPYIIDLSSRVIKNDDDVISLTQKEFDLSVLLFRNIGRLMPRGQLLELVWGRRPDLNTRTVDTHVSRIRSKLNLGEENGWRLTAVYQHGYRLEMVTDES